MTRPPLTPEIIEQHQKVNREMLTEYNARLNVVNAQIDAEDEASWELDQMKIERGQLLGDIDSVQENIAYYVERLSGQPTPNEDATVDYDRIESYLNEAVRDLTYAKGQKTGSSYERVNLENVLIALQNAVSALSRDLSSSS